MAHCGGPRKKEERRMKLTNHEWLRAGRLHGTVVDCGVPDGNGVGRGGPGTGDQHDDGSGDGVSGEWPAGYRDTGGELAIVYDGERPTGGGRQYDGDDCARWICERQSGPQPGGDAGGAVLHGGLLSERWRDEHSVLGGSGGGAGDAGAGSVAIDAGSAGCAGGEQVVCGSGDPVPCRRSC